MKRLLFIAFGLITTTLPLFSQGNTSSILKCINLEEAINRADQPDKV